MQMNMCLDKQVVTNIYLLDNLSSGRNYGTCYIKTEVNQEKERPQSRNRSKYKEEEKGMFRVAVKDIPR